MASVVISFQGSSVIQYIFKTHSFSLGLYHFSMKIRVNKNCNSYRTLYENNVINRTIHDVDCAIKFS